MSLRTLSIPNDWNTAAVNLFVDSVKSGRESYFVFIGDSIPEQGTWPKRPDPNPRSLIEARQKMTLGKRVHTDDVSPVINNIPYIPGQPYVRYDDIYQALSIDPFYVIVNAGTFYHVWKCLDNNGGANSTVQPDAAHLVTGEDVYRTSDNYVWKYMCSVDETTVAKFGTLDYFPIPFGLVGNSVPGAIDVISVDEPGQGYDNYISGVFNASDCRVGGNNILYAISNGNHTNGFYTGCLMYISAGVGVGQYRKITDYFTTANGNYAVVETPFDVKPLNNSRYEINPSVAITGQGNQTINAVARAVVNAVGNTIWFCEMFERGAGYTYMQAGVVANNVVSVSKSAIVRPVYGPPGGHGANPATELYCNAAALTVTISNTESNTVPATNDFQQLGILKDPLYTAANISFGQSNGIFHQGETVYSITTRRVVSLANVAVGNTTILGADTSFDEQFGTGDWIYLTSVDGNHHQLVTVASVPDGNTITLTANALFSANVSIDLADVITLGTVTTVPDANSVVIGSLPGSTVIVTGDLLVGQRSGAEGVVGSVIRSGQPKSFDTFVSMWKYVVANTVGTFSENETVFQGTTAETSAARASLHSIVTEGANTVFYTFNQIGNFSFNTDISGDTSGASGRIVAAYPPEIDFNSGQIVYLENIGGIPRATDQSQTFNIVLQF